MIFPDIKLEEKLWNDGYTNVVGLDEAGRGPLAGPVVAGAVIIHNLNQVVPTVRDSKKMSERQRESAFNQIKELSSAFGIGVVSSGEIDEIGIQIAVKLAMQRALDQVKEKYSDVHYLIADGKNVSKIEGYEMMRITKGDLMHYSISAASVLAKVTRDRLMLELSQQYPDYGFENHVGYGTKKHIEKIYLLGPCDIHRKTFEPIKSLLNWSK